MYCQPLHIWIKFHFYLDKATDKSKSIVLVEEKGAVDDTAADSNKNTCISLLKTTNNKGNPILLFLLLGYWVSQIWTDLELTTTHSHG